jgi:hypothetical protein
VDALPVALELRDVTFFLAKEPFKCPRVRTSPQDERQDIEFMQRSPARESGKTGLDKSQDFLADRGRALPKMRCDDKARPTLRIDSG